MQISPVYQEAAQRAWAERGRSGQDCVKWQPTPCVRPEPRGTVRRHRAEGTQSPTRSDNQKETYCV